MSFEPGTVIAGKYRVERVIGQGGMGVVLAARHLGLDEMVAVKLIREERADGADALARFQREARAAARIKSEHVARVLDVDRLPEGMPYIVMELIDGTDLHALVRRRGRLPFDETAAYVLQACEGLAEAHALGMVHRDLKLKNLFLTTRRDGRALIKVIDFGVVKLLPIEDGTDLTHAPGRLADRAPRDLTLTGTAMLVGSVHYMAPEQIRASNVVDARADVWSLGVCLFTMLTGALPFDGNTVADVCTAIQGRPVDDVRMYAPDVPPALAAAVTRALEKDVRRRFANVGELASALAPFGIDAGAPSRIETILSSSVAPRGALPPAFDPEAGGTITSDAPLFGRGGRAESTIDAAAVGSLATYPSPPLLSAPRSSWFVGGLVMLAAAAATLLVWRPTSVRPPSPAPAQEAPLPPPTTTASAEPPPPAPFVLPPAPAVIPPVLTSAAPPAPTGTPRASKKSSRPASRPETKAAPAPRPEPSSAYDHF